MIDKKRFREMRVGQNFNEFCEFLKFIKMQKCESYLEIGSRFGGSFYYIVKSMPTRPGPFISIDLENKIYGKGGSKKHLDLVFKSLKRDGYSELYHINSDSRMQVTVDTVRRLGPFDLVFIDGDHRYQAVKADWENYRSLGRIVAFHDIDHRNSKNRDPKVGCPRLWDEIKNKFLTMELVDPDARGYGIGIVKNPERI